MPKLGRHVRSDQRRADGEHLRVPREQAVEQTRAPPEKKGSMVTTSATNRRRKVLLAEMDEAKKRVRAIAAQLNELNRKKQLQESQAKRTTRNSEAKMCAQKRRFANQPQAVDFAASLLSRGVGMRAYACPHCNGWHLTSSLHKRGINNTAVTA